MSENTLKTKADKFSYALGLSIAADLKKSGIQELEYGLLAEGLKDMFEENDFKLRPEEASQIIQEFFMEMKKKENDVNLKAGQDFLAKNALDTDVVSLPSGMQYKVLTAGTGVTPVATDTVKCHYHGTLIDGTVFDSSIRRGQPAEFPVNGVIRGWVEALQLMAIGSKWRLFIPPHLAYGEQGAGASIGPNATLIFDVELLDIVK
ncbi:MAG: FKBP-type peptidyl-prolyl cis-trans isomerase [Bacteroidota bacterium]|nr:FKBP-type peptidyl-prolyl cis-trans isomerase [Bacteroidota bacterium]MDP4206213.1 FKBP-type peptidyl-prolyl cis-trans isomerase [Bacteroidota bacterium]